MRHGMTWVAALCIAAGLGCASKDAAKPCCQKAEKPCCQAGAAQDQAAPEGFQVSETATMEATVVAIDQKTRHVTLRGENGKEVSFKAGPDVKNLAQVKKGDIVTASYVQAVAVTLQKPGTADPGISTASEVQRAKPGEKPAAVVGDAVTVTATITNVDTKTQMVTLQGPKGGVVDLRVKDPAVLQTLKAGDLVEATYTEALAIAVESPKKK